MVSLRVILSLLALSVLSVLPASGSTSCNVIDDTSSVTRLGGNKLSVVSFKINSDRMDVFNLDEFVHHKYNLLLDIREVLEGILSPLDSDYHVHIDDVSHDDQTGHFNINILLSASEEELNTLDVLITEGKFGDLGPIEGYCIDPEEFEYTGKLVIPKSTLDDYKRRDSYYY